MEWLEVGKKIASVGLTTLGTVVAGPAGGAIGTLLGKAISGENDEKEITPETVMKAVGDPDALLKMKQFEMEHSLELQKLVLQEQQMYLSDKASARMREVETTKSTGKRDVNLYVLAYMYTLGFFISIIVMVWMICTGRFPENIPQAATFLIGNLFGALTAGTTAIVQYFFGSSKSSAEKTGLLAQAEPIKK